MTHTEAATKALQRANQSYKLEDRDEANLLVASAIVEALLAIAVEIDALRSVLGEALPSAGRST